MIPLSRELIVPCDDKGHRVRLRSGRFFFASVRCPRCSASVDPFRWRRVVRFSLGLAVARTPDRVDLGVWAAAWIVFALTLLGVLLFRLTADVWWPATTALYGPRWVFLLPLVSVAGLAIWRDRAMLGPLGLALLVTAGPFLGFRVNPSRMLNRPNERDVHVATLNAAGRVPRLGTEGLIDDLGADILMIQECGVGLAELLAEVPGWEVRRRSSLCAVSRYPIVGSAMMDGRELQRIGGSALTATFGISVDGRELNVTNVHLETPRRGFELMLSGQVLEGGESLRQKSILREIELGRAQRWVDSIPGPRIVVGDFNTPPESRHFQRHWGQWTDAFAMRGSGVGGTRLNGWIRPRIDYILVDDHWSVIEARTGPDVGSDHLPVIAVLRLRVD